MSDDSEDGSEASLAPVLSLHMVPSCTVAAARTAAATMAAAILEEQDDARTASATARTLSYARDMALRTMDVYAGTYTAGRPA